MCDTRCGLEEFRQIEPVRLQLLQCMRLNVRFLVLSVEVLRKNAKFSHASKIDTVGLNVSKFGKFVRGRIINWRSHTSGFVIISKSSDA